MRVMIYRGLIAPAILLLALATSSQAGVPLPADTDALLDDIRHAIETSDYDRFKELVLWKDAGKIKKRVVRFQVNRSLGRPIKSITLEDFPPNALAAAEATGKLELNMPVSHRVKVVYDEEPINDAGKLPTSVFVVGKKRGVYRIALMVRKGFIDDDGD